MYTEGRERQKDDESLLSQVAMGEGRLLTKERIQKLSWFGRPDNDFNVRFVEFKGFEEYLSGNI